MPEGSIRLPQAHAPDETACAYLLDDAGGFRACGRARQPGSSYCRDHHILCHLTRGSAAADRRLREIEVLANAVGRRRGGNGVGPSPRFIAKLEKALRDFSSVKRS